MKRLILFLLLIIIIVAATPLVGGYIYKRDFDKMINSINQDPKTIARVTEYHFGWLKSYAKIIITSKESDPTELTPFPFSNPQVVLDQEIIHGPIIFDRKNGGFAIGEAVLYTKFHFQPFESLLGVSSDSALMNIRTLMSYNEAYTSTFDSPAFTKEVPGKVKFVWGGFKGTSDMKMDKDNSHLNYASYNLTIAPFSVDSPIGPYELKAAGLTGKSDMTATTLPGLYNGSHNSTISNISYSALGKEVFTLDALNSMMKTKVDNNLFGLDVNLNLTRLNFPGQIEIKPANLNLAFNDLNGNSIVTISNMPYEARKNNPDLYPTVITPTSNVKGDLTLNTSQGNLNATVDVNWKGQSAPSKIDEMKTKTNMQLNLRISNQLLNYIIGLVDGWRTGQAAASQIPPAGNQTPPADSMRAQVNDLINRGYLVADKTDYTMMIVMEQGKIKINGKDFVPPTSTPPATSTDTTTTTPMMPLTPAPSTTSPSTPSTNSTTPSMPTETRPFQVEQDPRSQI